MLLQLDWGNFSFSVFSFIKVMELYRPPFYYLPEGPFQPNPLFNDPISVLNF